MTIDAYPLCWPLDRARTRNPENARFRVSFATARDSLILEVKRLCGCRPIISSNIPLRLDGLPYANRTPPDDAGVAVYFTYKKQQMCFACDKWRTVADNTQAIRKTIEALRGVARWGTGDMMERAFTGFARLEHAAEPAWWDVLGVPKDSLLPEIKHAYRQMRSVHHPDRGGDSDKFAQIKRAFEQATGRV